MTLRRRIARLTAFSTYRPSSSGPRWTRLLTIRVKRSSSRNPANPQIPHIVFKPQSLDGLLRFVSSSSRFKRSFARHNLDGRTPGHLIEAEDPENAISTIVGRLQDLAEDGCPSPPSANIRALDLESQSALPR